MKPIHLEGYDFIKALNDWMANRTQGIHQLRHWTLSPCKPGMSPASGPTTRIFIQVRLTWNLEGQCASLEQLAFTAEEATERVLYEFEQWEKAYASSKEKQ